MKHSISFGDHGTNPPLLFHTVSKHSRSRHGNIDLLARNTGSHFAGTNRSNLNVLSHQIADVNEHIPRDNRQGGQGWVRPSHSTLLQLHEDQQAADGIETPLAEL
jgi:hypothetical protein